MHLLNDAQAAIVDAEGKHLLLLNEVGTAVWYLINGRRTVSEIVATVIEALPAPADAVMKDVHGFLDQLRERQLIEYVNQG